MSNLRLLPGLVERGKRPRTALAKSNQTALGTFYALKDGTVLIQRGRREQVLTSDEMKFLAEAISKVAYTCRRRGEELAGLFDYRVKLIDGELHVTHYYHTAVFIPRKVVKKAIACSACKRWIQIGETRFVERAPKNGSWRSMPHDDLCSSCATPPCVVVREVRT